MEKTLIILKPDAVERKLVGEIISRFEKKNFIIVDMKLETISREVAETHYSHIKSLPIFDDMIDFMTSSPSIIMVLSGENVITAARSMIGRTNSFEAAPGTIRGDYGLHKFKNLIHASDSQESAETEIERFFA